MNSWIEASSQKRAIAFDFLAYARLQLTSTKLYDNLINDAIKAAKIKAGHPSSFADCFAAATAKKNNSVIMTGDPEFKKIEDLVAIEWLDN